MRLLGGAITLASLAGAPLHAQAGAILGTWRGTSICVREDWNSACNDEQVIYHVTRVPTSQTALRLTRRKSWTASPNRWAS